jgi:hypothetical protein
MGIDFSPRDPKEKFIMAPYEGLSYTIERAM